MPRIPAFRRSALSVRFIVLAISGSGVRAFECALSSRTSSLVHGVRWAEVFFFGTDCYSGKGSRPRATPVAWLMNASKRGPRVVAQHGRPGDPLLIKFPRLLPDDPTQTASSARRDEARARRQSAREATRSCDRRNRRRSHRLCPLWRCRARNRQHPDCRISGLRGRSPCASESCVAPAASTSFSRGPPPVGKFASKGRRQVLSARGMTPWAILHSAIRRRHALAGLAAMFWLASFLTIL